ncbi:DNA polymerase III, subunit gamma and tau [Gleimia coleocanis DSM 15436]|uniref:DNA polymerase III subunit gamma/tau n=1 Tax=Gleimia coleocanis DSM 15436 TaxID=525245 RepID=C0VYP8_9ACTO|nr:DNA polymerase III, subunit gamma and tau [Gleimia coleocanis DSM 15436]
MSEPLKAALKANRVTHAYLFSGPRGCGKTTSARILARCLNCVEGPTDTPCGKCASCIELATGGPGSLDVVEIDAASHNGVDDARELRERAAFAPARDRYKVFILDEAHMVTPQGFNALLKLVEEPPEHVKFVFATTEPERVIGTIRSRTHHYPFRLVPGDVLMPYLSSLCAAERISVAEGVLPLVVRAGGGSVRDSLSVLDQLMAGAENGVISYERAIALLGYTDGTLLDGIVTNLHAGDGSAVFDALERMVDSGHDPRRFIEDFLQRLRDLLVISLAPEGARTLLQGIPVEQSERMYQQAQQWGATKLSKAADLTDEALRSMVGATSPKLQVELLIGRILVEIQGAAKASVERAITDQGGDSAGNASSDAPVVYPSGLSGAALAREEARRLREMQEAKAREAQSVPVSPVHSAPAAQPLQPIAPTVSAPPVSVEPTPTEEATVPITPTAEQAPVTTAIPVVSTVEPVYEVPPITPLATVAEPAVAEVKLIEKWDVFTQIFLSEHAGWKNVVAALKVHQENEVEVIFQLPTVEQAEKLSGEKGTTIVAGVVEKTLGVVKRVKFVGPLEVAEAWPEVMVPGKPLEQDSPSEPVAAAEPATPIYVVPEPAVVPVQMPEPAYELPPLEAPVYEVEPVYEPLPEPVYESPSETVAPISELGDASVVAHAEIPEPAYELPPLEAPVYEPEPVYAPLPEPNYGAQLTDDRNVQAPVTEEKVVPMPPVVETYEEWDDETGGASLYDAEVAETREVGVPVVQRVFNAVVIEEIKEG